jgi:3-dehydroquinate synthase
MMINLGGGVISDLGGFVASTFKRGIDFVNVPTTLLGMVDASVGGKNGINLGDLKNQIGTINSPQMVVIDPVYLQSLPQNELRSGLAEMLKHGLISDKPYWDKFLDLGKLDFDDLDELIYDSVRIKNNIVTEDMTENGIRKALNFGHTLGHAIESRFIETGRPILHGEAVAAGMILESHISMRKHLLPTADFIEIKTVIKDIFPELVFDESDIAAIIDLLVHDKKNEYGNISFSLLNEIGSAIIGQSVDNELIMSAFKDYKL